MRLLKIVSLLIAFFCAPFVYASHILGGSMSYTYVSETSSSQTYKVRLVLYRDKSSATQFDNPITIGVHKNDNTKAKVGDYQVNWISKKDVTPPSGGSGCSFTPNIGIEQAIYEVNISVPKPSTTGYIVTYLRCCRTSGQVNIADLMGATYAVYIPSTTYKNNSPSFVGIPAPYICANDLAQVANAATDTDGDSLVYSVVRPYTGASSANPDPYNSGGVPATLSYPFNGVTYNTGFSATQPFGASGVANINTGTGLCDFKAPSAGNYSVAIEVKEYRNGVYLGSVRRDVILLVLNCPPNPPANLSGASGSGNTTPTVIAGETTCFPVTFTDTQDSIYITSFGDILDGTGGYSGPLATLRDTAGFLSATAQFCWTPACSSVRAAPYVITVQARDNGCPPKISTINYSIKVDPFVGTNSISGNKFICAPALNESYSISPRSGSTYFWTVTGGTIASGQNTSAILVNWPSTSTTGTVTVVETNSKGCVGINNSITVTIEAKPLSKTMSGDIIPCTGDVGSLYSIPAGPTGTTYFWGISGGGITSGSNTEQVKVNWGGSGTGQLYVVEKSAGGCIGDTTFLSITIRPKPNTNAGPDLKSCDPGAAVQLNATGAVIYNWSNDPTLSSTIIPDPLASPTVTTKYIVAGTLVNGGCITYDTVVVNVYSRPLPASITGDQQPCEKTTGVNYKVSQVTGSTYKWFVEGGVISGTTTGSSVNINWGNKGTGRVMLIETNTFGCAGDTVFYPITIREVPVVDAGIDTVICEGESVQMHASGAVIYTWNTSVALSDSNSANPISSPLNTIRYYVTGLLVSGGCPALDSVDVTVLNRPVLNIGEGDTICEGTTVELKVLVGTNFRWNTGETAKSIFVTPATTSNYWVLVQNQKCIFDTLKAFVVVYPKPHALFTPSDTSKIEPLTVIFMNTSTGAVKYDWTFGDGIGKSTDFSPTYTYEFPGKYIVKLVVENTLGCKDSLVFDNIHVLEQLYYIRIPNVFTPDGDGINDFFQPDYMGYISIRGEIYNRWGQKVYDWKGDDWWDGNSKMSEAATGEYYYFIHCEGRRGRKDMFKGSVTLIR